jgi:nicotinamidase-related amidase
MAKSALLVIDAQVIYERKGSPLFVRNFARPLGNINRLVDKFSAAGLPIAYVRHVHRKDNTDLGRMFDFSGTAEEANFLEDSEDVEYVKALKIAPSGIHLIKRRYSAFAGTELEGLIRTHKVDTLVITGYMTNFCCESTARDAHDRDYYVDFIQDAVGCPDLSSTFKQEQILDAVIGTLGGGYARIHSTKEYLSSMGK